MKEYVHIKGRRKYQLSQYIHYLTLEIYDLEDEVAYLIRKHLEAKMLDDIKELPNDYYIMYRDMSLAIKCYLYILKQNVLIVSRNDILEALKTKFEDTLHRFNNIAIHDKIRQITFTYQKYIKETIHTQDPS